MEASASLVAHTDCPKAPRSFSRRRQALAVLMLIIVAGAIVRTAAFRGFLGLDDGEYARLAYQIASPTLDHAPYTGPAVFPLRVGLTVPVAIAFKAIGFGEWPMEVYPFLISLCTIALAYACGAILFDRLAGLIAAALSAMMTLQVQAATTLLPDLPATFFGAAGVALILLAFKDHSDRDRSGLWLGSLAGLTFGMSWLCKESVVYLVPLCIALMFISARRHGVRAGWLWCGVAAGALLFLGSEMAVYRQVTGDILFRFHETERNYLQNAKYFFTEGSPYGWQNDQGFARAVFTRVVITGPAKIFLDRQALYLPFLALLATVYGVLQRDRSFLIPSLWFWSLAFAFDFGSSSLTAYRPLVLFNRYLLPVFFAACVASAGLLSVLLRPAGRLRDVSGGWFWRATGLACAAFVAWIGLTEVYFVIKYRPTSWASEVRVLARSITPDTPLLADTLSIRGLEFFERYPSRTAWEDLDTLPPSGSVPPATLVIINRRYLQWLQTYGGLWGNRTSGYGPASLYQAAPESWVPIWQNDNATVYRSGGSPPQHNEDASR